MAQKIHVEIEDDLTGGPADETIEFSLNGMAYELDLNRENADQFRSAMGMYVDAARPIHSPQRRGRPTRQPTRSTQDRQHVQEVRATLQAAGIPISDRGRLPRDAKAQYEELLAKPDLTLVNGDGGAQKPSRTRRPSTKADTVATRSLRAPRKTPTVAEAADMPKPRRRSSRAAAEV